MKSAPALLSAIIAGILLLSAAQANAGFSIGFMSGYALADGKNADRDTSPSEAFPAWCLNAETKQEFRACIMPFVYHYLLRHSVCYDSLIKDKGSPCHIDKHLDLIERGLKPDKE